MIKSIDPAGLPTPQVHGYLLGAVAPRPIAFASTVDEQGNVTSFNTFTTGANIVVQIIQAPDGSLYYVDLDDGTVGRWFFS